MLYKGEAKRLIHFLIGFIMSYSIVDVKTATNPAMVKKILATTPKSYTFMVGLQNEGIHTEIRVSKTAILETFTQHAVKHAVFYFHNDDTVCVAFN